MVSGMLAFLVLAAFVLARSVSNRRALAQPPRMPDPSGSAVALMPQRPVPPPQPGLFRYGARGRVRLRATRPISRFVAGVCLLPVLFMLVNRDSRDAVGLGNLLLFMSPLAAIILMSWYQAKWTIIDREAGTLKTPGLDAFPITNVLSVKLSQLGSSADVSSFASLSSLRSQTLRELWLVEVELPGVQAWVFKSEMAASSLYVAEELSQLLGVPLHRP